MPFSRYSRHSASKSRTALDRAVRSVVEVLEPRQMLTTVLAGQTFEFQQTEGDPNGLIRVKAGPGTNFEIVGSSVDEANKTLMANLPGRINGTGVFGNVAGTDGTTLIAQLNIPAASLKTQSLATLNGVTYGFNVSTQNGLDADGKTVKQGLVQLIRFDIAADGKSTTQVVVGGNLNNAIANAGGNAMDWPKPETGTPPPPPPEKIIESITAADFKPDIGDADSGLLFFVATGGQSKVSQMFTVDVNTLAVTAKPGLFGGAVGGDNGAGANVVAISTIAWDQTSSTSADLRAFGDNGGKKRMFQVNPDNTTAISNAVDVTEVARDGNKPVTDITGFAYQHDDPTAPEKYIIATRSNSAGGDSGNGGGNAGGATNTGSGPHLINIRQDPSSAYYGRSYVIAGLRMGGQTTTPFIGDDIQGLTFNPDVADSLLDASTGLISGSLIGVDNTTHSLVRISTSLRAPSMSIFNIYVTSGGTGSYITIGAVTRDGKDPLQVNPNQSKMRPFDGPFSPPTLHVVNNDSKTSSLNPIVTATAAAGTGSVYIGERSINADNDPKTLDDLRPLTEGDLVELGARDFGLIPQGTDMLPADGTNNIEAGIHLADGVELGKLLIGGTVTGQINLTGNLDQLYAGWLLTGTSQGLAPLTNVDIPGLTGPGDIRDVWVSDDVGTGTVDIGAYTTGFIANIAGRVQQFHVGKDLLGTLNIANNVTGLTNAHSEIENRGAGFDNGFMSGSTMFNNDTFATAQYLGSINSSDAPDPIHPQSIYLKGSIQNVPLLLDKEDYYAVALMAGQVVDVTVSGGVNFGIFDPDGRLIATDYNNVDPKQTANKTIRITADRPGAYRIAVATQGDADFTVGGEFPEMPPSIFPKPYLLTVTGIGNMGVGGVVVGGNVSTAITLDNGDFGALHSDTLIRGSGVSTLAGDVRLADAPAIGEFSPDGSAGLSPIVQNPLSVFSAGGIGLLRSTTGLLFVAGSSVKDTQVFDSAANCNLFFNSSGGIGTIKVGAMTALYPTLINFTGVTVLSVNADGVGFDGKIDLLDVTGDLGDNAVGGPHITTGPGGDIGYMRVGGDMYRDSIFGGGTPDNTLHDPGEAVTITDDSGAEITLTPLGAVTVNPLYNPDVPVAGVTPTVGPQLSNIRTYGIRDKGGSVLVSVSSSGGIDIKTDGLSSDKQVGIAVVDVTGAGTAPVVDPVTGLLSFPTAITNSLDVTLSGNTAINILSLTGGNFTNITQNTGGEILSVHAATIGNFTSTGAIGLNTVRHTPSAVLPIGVLSNAFPFSQQHNLIISGSIASIEANRGIGNLLISGTLQSLVANADKSKVAGNFAGINAPIMVTGTIGTIDIGEGVLPSGTGNLAKAGIFATGVIDLVTNSQPSDVRGSIVSTKEITAIKLNNGSIIGSQVMVPTALDMSRAFIGAFTTLSQTNSQSSPFYTIGSITLNGNGGIIGTSVAAADIGPIEIQGFGIFDSLFNVVGNGQIAKVSVGGYGIRNVFFGGGTSMAGFNATNRTALISTVNYAQAVRQSEVYAFDPYFDVVPNKLTDLHANLGSSAASPVIANVTDGGVIEDVIALGSRNLGSVTARQIRANLLASSTFNFANKIGSISTTSLIDGLSVRTGKLGSFNPALDVSRTAISIAGPISSMTIKGNFGRLNALGQPDSSIRAFGPNGRIGRLTIKGNLIGNIRATSKIGSIIVNGSISGNILVDGLNKPKQVLDKLQIDGSLNNGSLNINGSVGTIIVPGSFGLAGESLTISGSLASLIVGSNPKINGSVLALDLTVTGNLRSLVVYGRIDGNISVGQSLLSMKVMADGGFDPTVNGLVNGTITAGQKIGTIYLNGGNLNANVTSGYDITSVKILGGNVAPDVTITSTFGTVKSIDVKNSKTFGGSFLGNLVNPNGTKGKLMVSGNLGADTTASSISANQFSLLRVGGAINGNTTVSAPAGITTFQAGSIGGGVNPTNVSAGTFGTVKITGAIMGNANLTSPGEIKSLQAGSIGDNNPADGVAATTVSAARFSTLKIKGPVYSGSTITATADIGLLSLGGTPVSLEAGASITAAVIKKRVISGQVLGTITPA